MSKQEITQEMEKEVAEVWNGGIDEGVCIYSIY